MRSILLYEVLFTCFACVLASGHDDFYGRRYDHYHGKYSDSELMVDVLNNFGLKLLMAQNEHNSNNIAFSPYGIGVILIALGEGLRDEALYEIRKAIYLPYDAHTIRVGLRDIHRHLKSYFIPKEGFLAGITLNSENVSINPQYIQLLKFYGYDINSFNTALYPDSHITTTESGVMNGREETTTSTDDDTLSSTFFPSYTDNYDGANMTENSTILNTSTIQTTSDVVETTTTEDQTTIQENQMTNIQITQTTDNSLITTTLTETTYQGIPTEITVLSTTDKEELVTNDEVTTDVSSQANIDTTAETTTAASMGTENPTDEYFQTTTSLVTSSTETHSFTSTVPPIKEETSEDGSINVDDPQDINSEEISTKMISIVESVQPTTIPDNTEETTQLYTSIITTTSSDGDESEPATSTIATTGVTETSMKVRNVRSSEEISYFNKDEDELNVLGVVDNMTEPETSREMREFGFKEWSIDINNQLRLLNSIEAPSSDISIRPIINDEKRKPRSIEEYVINRNYYYNEFRPTKPYEADEPLYFFVNEKHKEAGLDFMIYDTVLPFLYLPNPSAMALAFPLDNDKYYLLLMLPSDNNQLDDLICKLYMHNTFKYILNNLELTHVKVNIPSFSLSGRITLTNSLQKLGIRRIFEPRQADFSPMTPTEGVYVTNIEQAVSITIKNNLNINRNTRHGHHYYSEPIRFNVNRPFLYFVIDSELQIILMTGKVVNPLNIRIK